MKLTNLQFPFFFVGFVWAMFNSIESISAVDNMAAPGWGVYVSSESFQWMGRWRIYQEPGWVAQVQRHARLTPGLTLPTTNRERRIRLEDLLFSSEITRPHFARGEAQAGLAATAQEPTAKWVRKGLEDLFSNEITWLHFVKGEAQGGLTATAKRGREIGFEDLHGQFGRTREDAAAQLGVSVSTFKRKCRKHGIKRWPVSLQSGDTIRDFFDGEINWSIENVSIVETSETPTTVPVIDQSAMSTIYRNPNPLLSVQPQVPLTQMASENLGGPLVSMQPQVTQMASENLGSPLVSMQPQVPMTQMASENLGSFDDGRTYLALQAQQDTGVVMIKAMYGKDTKLLFPFPVASGIIGLKGEVSKRLKFEVDSFDIKYEDHVGDLILIACDEDLIFYLNNIFRPLDDLVFKVVVISKTSN